MTKKFSFDCHNTLTDGIAIIKFFVNIINDLVFVIILYLFLLHIILKGKYTKAYFQKFKRNQNTALELIHIILFMNFEHYNLAIHMVDVYKKRYAYGNTN